MGEDDRLTPGRLGLGDDTIGTRANVRGGFTSRSSVPPDGPAWDLFANVSGSAPFICAVIPFHKVVADFCLFCHACEATRLPRAGQGAGEHPVECPATEPISQHHGLQSTQFGERDIRTTGVLAGTSPFGFPM